MTRSSVPRISVVLAVRNGAPFLRDAVESVLAQTFHDFECIVVDDASDDDTASVLKDLADDRVIRIRNPSLCGLAKSLNIGILRARGEYIARMDADDVCARRRFERQIRFMDRHPDLIVGGTWIRPFTDARLQPVRGYPTNHDVAKCFLVFSSPVAHPSAFMRRSSLQAHGLRYDEAFRCAQDYELWTRCVRFGGIASMPETLLLYRLHPRQASDSRKALQHEAVSRVRLRCLRDLGINVTPHEAQLHNLISDWHLVGSDDFVNQCRDWIHRLWQANERSGVYPRGAFGRVLGDRWYSVCVRNRRAGPSVYRMYRDLRFPGEGSVVRRFRELRLRLGIASRLSPSIGGDRE